MWTGREPFLNESPTFNFGFQRLESQSPNLLHLFLRSESTEIAKSCETTLYTT